MITSKAILNRLAGRVAPCAASGAGVAMLTRFGTPVNRHPVREQPAAAKATSVCMLHFAHQPHKIDLTPREAVTGRIKTSQQHAARHIECQPNITLRKPQAFGADLGKQAIIFPNQVAIIQSNTPRAVSPSRVLCAALTIRCHLNSPDK